MTTPWLIVLLVLFAGSGFVMLVSVLGRDRGIDFYDLDHENAAAPERLDALRKPWVFYTATFVLLGTAAAYLWWKAYMPA